MQQLPVQFEQPTARGGFEHLVMLRRRTVATGPGRGAVGRGQGGDGIIHPVQREEQVRIMTAAEAGVAMEPGAQQQPLEGNHRHPGSMQAGQYARQLN